MIVHKHKRVDSAPFYYGRQNAQHIAAASIHSYSKYIQNSGELQWGDGFFLFRDPCFNAESPRSRGEYVRIPNMPWTEERIPPLTRGILSRIRDPAQTLGITPAYAGNTCNREMGPSGIQDHPRLRGEYHPCWNLALHHIGSPPLTRGIHTGLLVKNKVPGITPAYAGNTQC